VVSSGLRRPITQPRAHQEVDLSGGGGRSRYPPGELVATELAAPRYWVSLEEPVVGRLGDPRRTSAKTTRPLVLVASARPTA